MAWRPYATRRWTHSGERGPAARRRLEQYRETKGGDSTEAESSDRLKAGLAVLGELAGVALRSGVAVFASFVGAGLGLAAMVGYALRDRPGQAGLIAILTIVEAVAAGGVLGIKCALIKAVAHGIQARGLARSLFGLLFDKMLGVGEAEKFQERGGRVAQGIERLPLAEAEDLLRAAVGRLTESADNVSGVRARLANAIRSTALRMIERYTLSRFREVGATSGGVDLVVLRKDLEPRIDAAIAAKLSGSVRLWMAIGSVGLPAAAYFNYIVVTHALGR